MRTITHIVVHCSATGQDAKVEAIQRYWKEKLGWKSPGYHYIIEADGKETQLLTIAQPSNGVKQAIIQGHKDFPNVAKACPCFDAKSEYKNI